MFTNTVIVLDNQSPHARLLARRLRERGQFSHVHQFTTQPATVLAEQPIAIMVATPPGTDVVIPAAYTTANIPVLITEQLPSDDAIDHFLRDAGSSFAWKPSAVVESLIADIRQRVGNKRVMLAISGGVDSTTLGVLLHRAIGKQLIGVFVDHGLLRQNEGEQVRELLTGLGLQLEVVDYREEFFSALAGVSDPEEKRKIIGAKFIEAFTTTADRVQEKYGTVTFLGQGTLYSDVLESEQADGTVAVKSHHNVGGLPDHLGFTLLEPFRELFKDEVRELAAELGLPEHLRDRHPFPGPGLAIRIIGEVTPEKVRILQHVDHIFISKLREHNLYHETWQALAVLTPVRSVGVTDGQRTYGYTAALRAVSSVDAMDARWTRLPHEFLAVVSSSITDEVPEVNRVVFDITDKPPGTIEWE